MKNYAPDRLTRTAFHEAGHCVAGVLFGCRIGAVTIDGNEGGGCAWVSHPRLRIAGDDIERWIYRPVPLWPAAVRRALEIDVMVCLAGWAGAVLAPGVAARRATPSVLALDEADEHGRRPWPALARSERAAIATWQATPPEEIDDDDTHAAETIRLLHGDDVVTGTLHARWLNAEVRRLLEHRADIVERLAHALLEHKSLSGRAVRCLVAGDQHGTTSGIARDAPSDRGP